MLPFDAERLYSNPSSEIFLNEEHVLIWRSKVTRHSSVCVGPPRMSPPPTLKSHEWTLAHKPPHPSLLTVSLLLFPLSPLFTLWGLLKGAWLHFQLGAAQGSFPRGGWQEMKAVHIVPDAFQHYTWVEEKKLPLSCHLLHTACVYLQETYCWERTFCERFFMKKNVDVFS